MADVELVVDARGLRCPLPVIKAKKGVGSVPVGSVVEIQCTDPGSVADFTAWTRSTGHRLVEQREENGIFTFLIARTS